MARKVVTADQAAANYQRGMSGATQKYKEGIARTTVNPMQEAAKPEAMARYLDGVQQSVNSGRRAAALQNAPINRWRDNAMGEGANRLASGAAKAKDKIAAFTQKYAPVWQSISDMVAAMPKGGRANAKARAGAAIDAMMDAAGK